MGVQINWEDVSDYSTLPHDLYDMAIPSVELVFTRTNKLMAVVQFEVLAPEALKGRQTRGWYVLGTDEDPDGQDPREVIKSPGIRGLKKLIKACGQPLDSDIEIACGSIIGQQCTVLVTLEKDNQDRPTNRVSAFFPVGEQIPGSLSNDAAASLPKSNGAAGAPRPVTVAPAATPPAAPQAPATPRTVAPPPQEGGVAPRPMVARPVRQ